MWDVLGVLAFRVAAALNRGVPRLEAYVHRDHLPHRAAFAFGGPIVPVARPPRPASVADAFLRGLRSIAAALTSLGHAAADKRRARIAARRAADERDRALELAETTPLRVPIVVEEPPVAPAAVRLAALVLAGAVAISVLVVVLGVAAVRLIEDFLR
jgi:hypothetical protein